MKQPVAPWKRNLVSLIFLCLLLYAAFFTGGDALHGDKRTTTRLMMGTLVSITTWGVEEAVEKRGVAAAFAEMARVEALMTSKLEKPGWERRNCWMRSWPYCSRRRNASAL